VIGYVDRVGIMGAWVHFNKTEKTREEGWLSALRERVVKGSDSP
jgi:hypothetical protein